MKESGTIAYQFFEAPTNFTEDKWVQAIEEGKTGRQKRCSSRPCFLPRARRETVVASICAGRPQPRRVRTRSRRVGAGQGIARVAHSHEPANAMVFKPGTALRIRAGAVLFFQIHYTANGTPTKDRTSVGMIFAKKPPQQEMRNSAFVNPLFVIPPGADNLKVESAIQFNEDSHVWALFPHTHLRGKSWEYRLVYPDGRSEVVLSVPRYDFNWQTYYVFSNPLAVPKARASRPPHIMTTRRQTNGTLIRKWLLTMGSSDLGRDAVFGHHLLDR